MLTKEEDKQNANNTGDNGGFIETPNGRSWGREHGAGLPASDGPEPFGRTSRAIKDGVADIAAGHASGEHPALDAIIRKQPGRYAAPRPTEPEWSETVCTPECEHRRGNASADQGPHPTLDTLRLISDIKPSTKERLYHIEREVERHDRDFEAIRQIALNGASKGELGYVNDRVDHVHKRITDEVLPEIQSLRNKRLFKDILVITGLVVSIAGNIITLYALFIRHP